MVFKALQPKLVYDSVRGSAVIEVKNNVEPESHSLLGAGTWGHYALGIWAAVPASLLLAKCFVGLAKPNGSFLSPCKP